MANKPKWLAEGTTGDLLEELETLIQEGMEKKEVTRAKKIVKEIIERIGQETDNETILGLFNSIIELAKKGEETYEEELAAMVDSEDEEDLEDLDDDEDLDDEDEEEDLEEDEDEEEEDEEDEEEIDFDDLSDKELKRLAKREYGIKITKKMDREDIEDAILDAMEEELEEDDEEEDYSDWTIQELRKELKRRGMRSNNKATMKDMRQMLIEDDNE